MHTSSDDRSLSKTILLSLTALGIVYGDIGTSPLYAINEIFFGHGGNGIFTQEYILGAISLVIWALTIIVSFKYIVFVLKADNDGEGGVFALYGLLSKYKSHIVGIVMLLLVVAAGLLFGDGIITPAISVISAVEGLAIATEAFRPFIVPITIVILTGLFLIQKNGTSKVGAIFGPIVIVWFSAIAVLGFVQITHTPFILAALNPIYAFRFLFMSNFHTLLLVLGSVMLVVTGGEAMYADMGHFGRLPIRISWFSIVYPSLLLNYLGQGAYMLSGQQVQMNNIFYSMVPTWALIPMVILATLATIIASQALISGAFSLAQQATALGLFPYLKVIHTHDEHEGQIYVPFVNFALYVGCVLLVLTFRSSTNLASAYGLAVSGVMAVTTLAMIQIAIRKWQWPRVTAYALFIPLLIVDLSFLTANSLKLLEGGYIPLGIGIALTIIMQTWQWGRRQISQTFNTYPAMELKDLIAIKDRQTSSMPRTVVVMTPRPVIRQSDPIPVLKQMIWERFGVLQKNLIFLTVNVKKQPYMHHDRYDIKELYRDPKKGTIYSVIMNFGFMEEHNVELALKGLADHHKITIDEDFSTWNVHVMHERITPGHIKSFFWRTAYSIFKFMDRNAETADHFFGLGNKQPLSIEVIPVHIS